MSASSSGSRHASTTDPDAALRAASRSPFHTVLLPYLLGLLTAFTLAGGALFVLRRPDPPPIQVMAPPTPAPTPTAAPTPPPTPTATPGPIVVFVSGAVLAPGTFALSPGARIADAIAAAGGLRDDADGALVNQAERLFDGAQVHVPVANTAAPAPVAGLSGVLPTPTAETRTEVVVDAFAGGQINVNTATQAELETLPGIGASRAQAIIANRPFASVDDLDRVPGIGQATLERLRPLVTAP